MFNCLFLTCYLNKCQIFSGHWHKLEILVISQAINVEIKLVKHQRINLMITASRFPRRQVLLGADLSWGDKTEHILLQDAQIYCFPNKICDLLKKNNMLCKWGSTLQCLHISNQGQNQLEINGPGQCIFLSSTQHGKKSLMKDSFF